MKPNVSFLLGSGFSIPEGLPGVRQLNKRLSKINESEILIHSSQIAMFLNGQDDPNRWSGWDERAFLQEFLEFYNDEILKPGELFHYETFYDFYSGYIYNQENKAVIIDFYNRFNKKHFKGFDNNRDCYNRVLDFNRTFSQLLASQLHNPRYFEDVSYSNYPLYGGFIGFLRELLKTNNIKVHTLNHDLFFDFLGHHHADLWQHFSDGFKLEGSPFYGTISHTINQNTFQYPISKSYYIKLEQFINKFDKPLCLFKLHGSIFNKIIYSPEPVQKAVRLKHNYGVSGFFMEVFDKKTNEYRFEQLLDKVGYDFLSGTTNKTRFYSGDSHYKNLFSHFEINLTSSELLVVIGYGFQDSGINEYLEKYYLSKGKKMVIVDPNLPKIDLIGKYNPIHIPKGITEVTFKELLDQIPSSIVVV